MFDDTAIRTSFLDRKKLLLLFSICFGGNHADLSRLQAQCMQKLPDLRFTSFYTCQSLYLIDGLFFSSRRLDDEIAALVENADVEGEVHAALREVSR